MARQDEAPPGGAVDVDQGAPKDPKIVDQVQDESPGLSFAIVEDASPEQDGPMVRRRGGVNFVDNHVGTEHEKMAKNIDARHKVLDQQLAELNQGDWYDLKEDWQLLKQDLEKRLTEKRLKDPSFDRGTALHEIREWLSDLAGGTKEWAKHHLENPDTRKWLMDLAVETAALYCTGGKGAVAKAATAFAVKKAQDPEWQQTHLAQAVVGLALKKGIRVTEEAVRGNITQVQNIVNTLDDPEVQDTLFAKAVKGFRGNRTKWTEDDVRKEFTRVRNIVATLHKPEVQQKLLVQAVAFGAGQAGFESVTEEGLQEKVDEAQDLVAAFDKRVGELRAN
jgi:hypothetical protein